LTTLEPVSLEHHDPAQPITARSTASYITTHSEQQITVQRSQDQAALENMHRRIKATPRMCPALVSVKLGDRMSADDSPETDM
jgi:hypothetical protein